jgi:hypothetical protein
MDFTPRRSKRITKALGDASQESAPPPLSSEQRARIHIMRTVGILGPVEQVQPEDMAAYDKLFALPLKVDFVAALAATFNLALPADATVLEPCSPGSHLPAGCLIEV